MSHIKVRAAKLVTETKMMLQRLEDLKEIIQEEGEEINPEPDVREKWQAALTEAIDAMDAVRSIARQIK